MGNSTKGGKGRGKLRSEPTAAEIEEMREEFEARCAERLTRLRGSRGLAAEVFKVEKPTYEMVSGIAQLIESGVEENTLPAVAGQAIEEAAKFGSTETSDVLALCEILLEDEKAVDHLASARSAAVEMFGEEEGKKVVLDLYFDVYDESVEIDPGE